MNRTVDDMLLFGEKKRLKVFMMQRSKDIEYYDFHPSIKSGRNTKPRYMDPKKYGLLKIRCLKIWCGHSLKK